MSNVQKYIGLGLALAIGIGNGVYTFGPSLKEESERRKGEVLGGTLRPQETASQQQQPTATAKDKQEASKA
ncbi:hypothetical protein B0T18DRAFT_431953 [Schizothecium vesticola]|uniref:Uncharacterized protein n=1 Tax=Schizothecium vesticola TaxID=314040 RepID=A0AA40JZE2_9PEZI|nr:hypothetical protein B0T18DRAFT_431953 [Schizothecium vesticola]